MENITAHRVATNKMQAKLQICHITASHSSVNFPLVLEMVDACNEQGMDISAEQYP